jgi:hypothetical protein
VRVDLIGRLDGYEPPGWKAHFGSVMPVLDAL